MKRSRSIETKLRNLRARGKARVLDLFSGCGGISLGFASAGCEIVGAVELDPMAAASHGRNFHPGDKRHAVPRDIHTPPADTLRELGVTGRIDRAIDILVGGPPCQAFARIGRAKLREQGGREDAWLVDSRADLYKRYLEYVKELKPLALLLENVPDMLNHGGVDVAAELCEELEGLGYDCSYTLLNSAHFGVPQMRERAFVVAYRNELLVPDIEWPVPTHHHRLPGGYDHIRTARAAAATKDDPHGLSCFAPLVDPTPDLPRAVTAKDALSDLARIPALRLLETGAIKGGTRDLSLRLPYKNQPQSDYAQLMRTWPNFGSEVSASAHVIRYLPRDYRIFARMNSGDQYPEAWHLAQEMRDEEILNQEHGSRRIRRNTKRWQEIDKAFVPPYDHTKFPNKWRKMESNAPARTLMAHLGKDSYSHIHYDSRQARTISVREAARLQSFPDGFEFCGAMNAAFRQIGNAVPPLMAYAVCREMLKQLGLLRKRDTRLIRNHAERKGQAEINHRLGLSV